MTDADPVELFTAGRLCLFGEQADRTAQFVAGGLADRDAAMAIVEQAYSTMKALPLTIPALAV